MRRERNRIDTNFACEVAFGASQAFTMYALHVMHLMRSAARRSAAVLALVGATACDNQLPTVVGDGAFPAALVPVTVDAILPAERFVRSDTVYGGFEEVGSAGFRLVANQFGGVLTAHTLVRFSGFPDSVTYTAGGTTRTDRVFTYTAGRLVAQVDSVGSFRARTELEALSLVQPWDSAAVSWLFAVDRPGARTPWRMPGGTTGALLGRATWVPGDTARRDSIAFPIDSLSVIRLARGELDGVLIRSADPGTRLELGSFVLETAIRPAGRADTTIVQRYTVGPQSYIYTPDEPRPSNVLRVGGQDGARAVLGLDLNQTVSTCPAGQTGGGCRQVPLREVTIDQVTLLLQPMPVPLGFRPTGPATVVARRILEPGLGRAAPLGEVLATLSVPADAFAGPGRAPVGVDLTGPTRLAIATGETNLTLGLLSDLGVINFGAAWFDASPRLRLVYTVPARPSLP